ncbi:MAG: UDP-N-acetylmuramate dehydrogenase [Kangiellaceae bacterium]
MPEIFYNKNLRQFNTFKVEAVAEAFLQIDSPQELKNFPEEFSQFKEKLVVGGGSNLLFAGDYKGLIIYPQFFGIEKTKETDSCVYLKVSSSENWHEFVSQCLDKNYFGIENLALIPGTVGAAPVQNIGAYGVEVEQVIESVECFDLHENKFVIFSHGECEFAYRESRLKKAGQGRYLVCYVNFVLSKIAKPILTYAPLKKLSQDKINISPKNVFEWVCNIRKEKLPDPNDLPNAGSFFKNPIISSDQFKKLKDKFPELIAYAGKNSDSYKVAAGWLIDHAGLKGLRKDKVGIHQHQALVLVNFGEPEGIKIWQLACFVMEKIEALYSIKLEPEVRILGIDVTNYSTNYFENN